MPNEIFTINLNAQAIIPEAFILLGIVGTLLVDLAGEKTASKWAPIICYLSIGSSLVGLALQWTNPVDSAFLGAFNSDNLSIASPTEKRFDISLFCSSESLLAKIKN